jgi:Na+/H+ antiporter NhaD/arsenite permease-like protein
MSPEIIAVIIFIISYLLILSERIHRTIIAIIGASVVIFFGILTQEHAIEFVDFNTIGLLVGMMMIVSVMGKTGIFQYLAIKIAQRVKGHPMKILFGLAVLTAISSAFLDNVTTVLLLTPLIFVICSRLKISPIPFLFTEILVSNIGGTATLIGDPPNIMIGSSAKLTFLDFIINLGPVVIVIFLVSVFLLKIFYRKDLRNHKEFENAFKDLKPETLLEDRRLLKRSLIVLALVLFGFMTHGITHVEPATVALAGAGLLLFLGSQHPEESLKEVEWPVIFFFVGLFILVGGLEHTGIIKIIAEKAILYTEGNHELTTYFILWFSGLFSGIVDNIPFVATMIPLIRDIGTLSQVDTEPFWWALALGGDMGGNATLIGASANLVVASCAEKNGVEMGFLRFMKIGVFITLVSLIISTVYLGLFYV